MKIKIAYEDPRFTPSEKINREIEQKFGVEVEGSSYHFPLMYSIDAYRSGLCEGQEEEILRCLGECTYCFNSVLEIKEEMDCDGLLVLSRNLPRPPGRMEKEKIIPGIADREERVGLVWQWASTIEVLHEAGHLVGLEDCSSQPCLMNGEERSENLCDKCSEKTWGEAGE